MDARSQRDEPRRGSVVRAAIAGLLAACGVLFGVSVQDLTDRSRPAALADLRMVGLQRSPAAEGKDGRDEDVTGRRYA